MWLMMAVIRYGFLHKDVGVILDNVIYNFS